MFGSIKSNGFVLSLDKCNIFIPGAKNDKTSWELFLYYTARWNT